MTASSILQANVGFLGIACLTTSTSAASARQDDRRPVGPDVDLGAQGQHYHFDEMTFLPTPVQQPRIPIWVAAAWPRERSMRRAIRWDGILPQVQGELTPDHVRAIADYVARERPAVAVGLPFDIVSEGTSPADDPEAAAAKVEPWIEAGATWWMEADWHAATVESVRRRILAYPSVAKAPSG